MILKIVAYGFIMTKNTYLRDYWNILDFIIVISGSLATVTISSIANLTSLRSLRVLRPLKTLSSIKSLK